MGHNKGGGGFKKVCKRVAFQGQFCGMLDPKVVIWATKRVQNTLGSNQRGLSIS